MSELTISAVGFNIQPIINIPDGTYYLRWYYTRAFLSSEGVQVMGGNGFTGWYVRTQCTVAGGVVVVDEDTTLWTTDNAQDPNVASIQVSAGLFNTRGVLIQQLTIADNGYWVVPNVLAAPTVPATTWQAFSTFNQANPITYTSVAYYTREEVERRIQQGFDENPASDLELGSVLLTVPADSPTQPVVWGANDPLVRDAVKFQGVDVDATPPNDGEALVFNQATNSYEPVHVSLSSGSGMAAEIQAAASDETTALTTGAAKVTFRMPRAMTLTGVRASLSTAQTSGSILTVNIKQDGVTILSTKITIDNGEKTSTTAATPPVISDSALPDDSEITVDIDQVGDGTAKGLKITLLGTWT